MPTENAWADPRTWITLGSLVVGFIGMFYGILSGNWNRRESRLDSLSKVLQPLVKSAQELHLANGCRQRCERLKFSFPDPKKAPDAVKRVNDLVEEYNLHIESSHTEFRLAESEFSARSFRFPDKIVKLVKTAVGSLAEFGRLVNNGYFDKAELQFAKFRDDYGSITREGRGWRLADPFEGLRQCLRSTQVRKEPEDEYGITEKVMNDILELVHKRATSEVGNTFAVHPPKKLLERPEIAKADNVIQELQDSIFVVAFQDGTARLMTLAELMVLTYNLVFVALQHREIAEMMSGTKQTKPCEVTVTMTMSLGEIMRPAMVKALLEKIDFSDVPSDDAPPGVAPSMRKPEACSRT